MSGLRSWRLTIALIAPLLFAACTAPASTPAGTSQRLLLTFAQPPAASGPELAASLGRSTQVELEFLEAVGPNVLVFTLKCAASDADCGQAIARLRSDSRLLSAELDAKRERHGS